MRRKGRECVLEACEEFLETWHHVFDALFELDEGLVRAGVGGAASDVEGEVTLAEDDAFALLADAHVETHLVEGFFRERVCYRWGSVRLYCTWRIRDTYSPIRLGRPRWNIRFVDRRIQHARITGNDVS